MRLAFVLGTRPEIIKMAPVILEARSSGTPFSIIHSGQHYDQDMDARFFDELGLPQPDVRLSSGGRPYAEQVAYLLKALYETYSADRPDAVIVQGDTVTVMCAALAAQRLGIPVIHHEAGLRSRDQRMSEEYHRIITDHLSAVLCAPTETAVANLRLEGVPSEQIHLTGNTVVDAVRMFSARSKETSDVLSRFKLTPKGYFLLTLHRAENVDSQERFEAAMESLARVAQEHPDRPIIFPVHPRVERRRQEFGAKWPEGVRPIPVQGYLDMLRLVADADCVLTDSGGLQEEASILGIPCVTLRDSTERPETVEAGMNIIAGLGHEAVSAAVRTMRGKTLEPARFYGDGFAAARILNATLAYLRAQASAVA